MKHSSRTVAPVQSTVLFALVMALLLFAAGWQAWTNLVPVGEGSTRREVISTADYERTDSAVVIRHEGMDYRLTAPSAVLDTLTRACETGDPLTVFTRRVQRTTGSYRRIWAVEDASGATVVPFQPHRTADTVGGCIFLAAFAAVALFGGRHLTMMIRILRHPERFTRRQQEQVFDRGAFAESTGRRTDAQPPGE